MKIGLMVVTLVGWGCGGEVDPSAVLTLDGELRNMEDLYDDPAATGTAGARGVRELHQLDPNQQLNSARLDFLENGRLRVSPLSRDHGEDTRIELWGGYRTCALGERWRLIDEHRLGLLFACKDGLAREAVFRSASKLTIASTVERWTSLLELESVGSDRIVAGDPHARWGTYEFGLRTPD